MSIALHFLKRDLRRTWWLFALWVSFFVIEDVLALSSLSLGHSKLALDSGSGFMFSGFQFILFPVLHFLVLAVLIPQLVQEDPLVGSTAFWLTRPVGRSSLLKAKGAGLTLIVLIPVVVYAAVLFAVGLSASELALAMTQILLSQLFFVVPIALLAALTPSFGRFAVAVIAVAVGLGALLAFDAVTYRVEAELGNFALAAAAKMRTLVEWVIVILGGSLVLIHQYLTRCGKRSVALALCLSGAYVLAVLFCPRNLTQDELLLSVPTGFDPTHVTLQITPGSLNNVGAPGFSRFTGKNIDGPYRLLGLPPEGLFQVRSVKAQLITLDGTAVKTFGPIPTVPLYQFDPPHTAAIAAALGDIPVYNFLQGDPQTTFVTVDGPTFLKYKDSPLKLVDDFDLVVSRYELATELPLVVGSGYDHGSIHTRIDALISRSDGVTINIVESSVNLLFGSSFRTLGQPNDPRFRTDLVYVLVNRSRREAILVSQEITRMSATTIHLGGLLTQQILQLPFGGKSDPRSPKIDNSWLAGAKLVRLERVPLAEFRKTVEVDLPKLGEPWLSFMAAPKDLEPTGGQAASELTINLNQSGTITVDAQPVADDQLETLLGRAHHRHAISAAHIVADKGISLEKLSFVLRACRTAQIGNLRLESR